MLLAIVNRFFHWMVVGALSSGYFLMAVLGTAVMGYWISKTKPSPLPPHWYSEEPPRTDPRRPGRPGWRLRGFGVVPLGPVVHDDFGGLGGGGGGLRWVVAAVLFAGGWGKNRTGCAPLNDLVKMDAGWVKTCQKRMENP